MTLNPILSLLFCLGFNAITQVFRVIDEQSQATFDDNYNIVSYYNWTGQPGKPAPVYS